MAHQSFPNNAYNSRALTLAEYEQVTVATGLSGLLFYDGTAPVFADSSGRQVKLRAGVASWTRGTRFNNTSETIIPIAANSSGKTRIDLVVLRKRREESGLGVGDQHTVTPYVIEGVAADNPVAPSPTRNGTSASGFWDLPLAEVTVPTGASSIAVGQVVCRAYYVTGTGYTGRDAWAKPPVEPGVIFHAADTGISYIGTAGGAWLITSEDSGWVAVPLQPGWSASPTGRCRVRRLNRVTYLQMDLFRNGADISAGGGKIAVGTVPDGFQPDQQQIALGAVSISGGTCRVSVESTRALAIDIRTAIPSGQAISVLMQWPLATT